MALEVAKIGGVDVEIYTPADIPARNRKRVVMMFNSDPTGVSLAAIAGMKVVSVHYNPRGGQGSSEIADVYRELLKTHKPDQIAWVGLSGGCQFVGNTAMWLPSRNLPFPAALGLLTCAGGGVPGDTRHTLNGLDIQLSDFTPFGAMRPLMQQRRQGTDAPPGAGEPVREILDGTVPAGFPPSYVLSGTRDMSLSQSVLLHRKLRRAGVEAELNIWEGMWHGFNMELELPETREAAADMAEFLDRHMSI